MDRICVVLLAGNKQNECFWPSYNSCDAGVSHDLIVIHRDKMGLPDKMDNIWGDVILKNKIINGVDVPHRAFGGYRFAYQEFKYDYDLFTFISDDVIIKMDNWLLKIVNTLNKHERLGFGASQIFNGGKKYPHPSHLRAPFWFAKTKALNDIKWEFNGDHDGEMKIGDQLTKAGYFGVQVGNKINLGYDALEPNHITQLMEKKYSKETFPLKKHLDDIFDKLGDSIFSESIESPFRHIGKQNLGIDLEPFDGLIYAPSIEIAKKYLHIENNNYNTYILK